MGTDELLAKADGIAARIRGLRKELGLNQADFAARIDVSRGYISDVENGRARPSVELLFAIQNAFLSQSSRASWAEILQADTLNAPADSEGSRLSAVVSLDGRALETAIERVDALEASEGQKLPSRTKARLIRGILYVYVDQLEKALARGADMEAARAQAASASEEIDISAAS